MKAIGRRLWRWGTGIALVAGLVGLFGGLLLALTITHYGAKDRARPADVIVVLGGGVDGTARRTQHAVALFHRGYAPYILCTGGVGRGSRFSEAAYCAQIAQQAGVPAAAIVLEERSRSTEENAIQAAAIMQARGWQTAVLVSDDYHLWRARWIFSRQGVTVWPSPAQITSGKLGRTYEAFAVLRETVAFGWQIGKSALGLPFTRTPI